MKSYKEFINFTLKAQTTKKCPEGYRFDKNLGVCVPKGVTRYYPFYGLGSRSNGSQNSQNGNGNGDGNGNGNGNGNGSSSGNGAGGNGASGGNGSGGGNGGS
tara:strand:+ start:46 stop:351 length:306 start_codon:yes stop_codon:yes gene_type:complete